MNPSLGKLLTEQQNPRTTGIDDMTAEQILRAIHEEDRTVPAAVERCIPEIAKVVEAITESFRTGGRLLYAGAGTSGRLGILDASECPPTYGSDPEQVIGLIAGGSRAIQQAVEGAEDNPELGRRDIREHQVSGRDVVVGIAASGRTPYVLGAMQEAVERGAVVVGISNNPDSEMGKVASIMIEAVTGPEAIVGSTRMKAGTAQKLILNMLTTASMIRSGKVYRNLMVDMQATNEKLALRARRLIQLATEADDDKVEQAYLASGGHVKTAIVMILLQVDADAAAELLQSSGGFVRQVLDHSY
ncbi:N-acetylmuramic acid 6-phosphate etherase [Paenibacillus bovis]|uniref:N-acetylmuramic acid 6-phosphate etherase n=1 Tax=Paenibacillus bovis TaxID=1616788 RepID=A0A172ZCY6_9BACL|nr:N-acetylmuramic acid 6-phosphate etherase [Paenibacillus bovis]ANF95505.1 N-acetylmuramic acid 6-phosphate etherase [Paenibacillus bovis]